MSGGGAGAALPPPGVGGTFGAGAGMGAGAAGGAGGMAGGWQMPAITGGTKSLYAAPGATGAMVPPSSSWLQDHPKAQQALLQFGAQLLQQQRQPPAGGGHFMGRPPISGPMGMATGANYMGGGTPPPNLAPPSVDLQTGGLGPPITGMQQYAGYGGGPPVVPGIGAYRGGR